MSNGAVPPNWKANRLRFPEGPEGRDLADPKQYPPGSHFFGAPETRTPNDRCTICGEQEAAPVHKPEFQEARTLENHPDGPITGAFEQARRIGREMTRWADAAMFRSEEMVKDERGRVVPRAYLLNATPDPLGSLAALNAIYTGGVKRSLAEVTDEERREALVEVRKNKLQGPMEVVSFHFLLEGVSRAFTHQIVRGRHAFYAQESLRFAVVEGEDWESRMSLPPSLEGEIPVVTPGSLTPEQEALSNRRAIWNRAANEAQWAYEDLIAAGVPAEDARGVMPHAMTTRIHWVCSLRELLYVAGVRLCTQAQFEWRTAMASVVKALREYQSGVTYERHPDDRVFSGLSVPRASDSWQFESMADLLRPICYQEGACGFKAKADRSCSIRERVDFRERYSLDRKDSSKWHLPLIADVIVYPPKETHLPPAIQTVTSPGIDPAEWLTDPGAAR
jgi:flavin-dependent thymidylate synthase